MAELVRNDYRHPWTQLIDPIAEAQEASPSNVPLAAPLID